MDNTDSANPGAKFSGNICAITVLIPPIRSGEGPMVMDRLVHGSLPSRSADGLLQLRQVLEETAKSVCF